MKTAMRKQEDQHKNVETVATAFDWGTEELLQDVAVVWKVKDG